MRLENMNEDDRDCFISKFSLDELDTISRLLIDLNKEINIPEIKDLILEIRKECKNHIKGKNIDIKYILKKFDYGELETLNYLLQVNNSKKYEKEKQYVSTSIRNYQLLAKQTQDFETLGFDLAVYYWESLSPHLKNWYASICHCDNMSANELYVYCKKINDEKHHIN